MQERFAPASQFIDQMRPVAAEAQAAGSDPVSYIQGLAQSERTLRTADLPTKFQELLRIANQYGIPLGDVINQSVGQEIIKKPQRQQMQIPQEFQQELQYMRQWRENNERGQAEQVVNQFGADKEFLGDVRNVMADLIERGIAPDLATAYDQACWMVPEVRAVMLQRQTQTASATSITTRQAKATGVSIPASGRVDVPDADDAADDTSATVRKAWLAAQGRV
jgi:hypothetical protein